MERRSFLGLGASVNKSTTKDPALPAKEDPVSQLQNQHLPKFARVSAGLEAYAGDFGWWEARHLLSRALFGAKHGEISQAVTDGLDATLDRLFADWEEPSPPINHSSDRDISVPKGEVWVEKRQNNEDGVNNTPYRRASVKYWNIGLMVDQEVSLREKMVLFWHNHIATELVLSGDPRGSYELTRLFRKYALGNFKTLVEEVTVNAAMLVYLNGIDNKVGAPNENYGRELLELFTIGKGPQIGEGNYTNYTEDDVIEASKVLTGWRLNLNGRQDGSLAGLYKSGRHDKSTKTFSEAFDNATIENAEEEEYKLLISMIFGKRETARYICRKLYRWFVYYVIDEAAEENVIEPMADMLINNSFEVKPVIRALLSSAHFFDADNQGCMIKSPMDYVLSMVRSSEASMPDLDDYRNQYSYWNFLYGQAKAFQQDFLTPPSVAGWPAYYQEPAFYQLWVNSATLPNRQFYINIVSQSGGKKIRGNRNLEIDVFKFMDYVSDPGNPNLVVREIAQILLPQAIPNSQKNNLKDILIPGLPDFEWTEEYLLYISDPSNEEIKMAVESKLRDLVQAILSLPEFHLM